MAAVRPTVSVYAADTAAATGNVSLPGVFATPLRPDVVLKVHAGMAKNTRQAYSVNKWAGKLRSAESWGTGRAVSRIPRVSGGGTHAAGSGAFGNMCRHGRMFAPTKTWRKFHQKLNQTEKRYALASAIAASGVASLVTARGHRIGNVNQIPLVVADTIESTQKTANAAKFLNAHGAAEDLKKVKDSKKVRRGKGKMRNRRYVQRRGPLVVYNNDDGVVKAFRNIPGVELANVNHLNLLQMAPGGHLGRFVIWTESAFQALDKIYGSDRKASAAKRGYHLPRTIMTNSDLARIINSDEIQSVVKPAQTSTRTRHRQKKNPLKNNNAMAKLNPYAVGAKRRELREQERRAAGRQAAVGAARKGIKAPAKVNRRAQKTAFYNALQAE